MNIKTEEERKQDVINQVKSLIHYLGGNVVFKKPIRFRDTPHTKTKYIHSVSLDTCFEGMDDELNAINQRLKYIKNENSQNRAD